MSGRLFDHEKLDVYRAWWAFIAWLEPILDRLPSGHEHKSAALDVWVAKSWAVDSLTRNSRRKCVISGTNPVIGPCEWFASASLLLSVRGIDWVHRLKAREALQQLQKDCPSPKGSAIVSRMSLPNRFQSSPRLLMGPGPSNVAPSVLDAISRPLLGHLDPLFIRLMDEIKSMLREVFQTENQMTFPVSGTGSAGMEFCFVNLIEPGDEVVIGVNGVFGQRMVDVAERCGAQVIKVEAPWGEIIRPDAIRAAIQGRAPKLVAVVHAETSTGAWTPADEIGPLVRESGALFVLDTVTSLAGCPVRLDAWGVDAAYSGTQKCLSCPPGLAPVSLSERALEVARKRKRKVQSWYLDVNLLASYWGEERVYHHTAPISMNYALHEALRLVLEEGLEIRWHRHQNNHQALKRGLSALGLNLGAQEGHRLWQLNAVEVPAGIDEASVRKRLLNDFGIEVGAGLGPLKGKVWRVGLMGATCRRENVQTFLSALGRILKDEGSSVDPDAALAATQA